VPYHDRAAIEDGALAGRGLELIWLADPFEAFLVQVQGSARLRLPDGTLARVAYAGRNGHPYTSIGRVLVERGILTREEVDLPRIRAVFAGDPALAREVMRRNRSFVFFRLLGDHDPSLGPIGAQGLPLTPGRSIAIDRTVHSYGLPFFVLGEHPGPAGATPVRRLVIAQDTGTAIVGPGRIDWFAGWGDEAERLAGLLRHPVELFVLRPRMEALP
jgi:membrane-bound lytic murein transglycosylase A